MRLFSQVSVIFTVIQTEWLTTNSQNAILNNFEEYYNSWWDVKPEFTHSLISGQKEADNGRLCNETQFTVEKNSVCSRNQTHDS